MPTSRSMSCTDLNVSRSFAALGGAERELLDRVEPILDALERQRAAAAASARSIRPPIGVTVRSISCSSDPARVPLRRLDDLQVAHRRRIDEQAVGAGAEARSRGRGRDRPSGCRAGSARARRRRERRPDAPRGRTPSRLCVFSCSTSVRRAGSRSNAQPSTRRDASLQVGVAEQRGRSARPDPAAGARAGAGSTARRRAPAGRWSPGYSAVVNSPVDRSSSAAPRPCAVDRPGQSPRGAPARAPRDSLASVSVPGETTRTTSRRTRPLAFFGSSTCSQMATRKPLRTRRAM